MKEQVARSIAHQPGACIPRTTIALRLNSFCAVSDAKNIGSMGSRMAPCAELSFPQRCPGKGEHHADLSGLPN
jgi:hypothetical protein